MYDKELALEILRQIYNSGKTILKRFEPIQSPEDFSNDVCQNHIDRLAQTIKKMINEIEKTD